MQGIVGAGHNAAPTLQGNPVSAAPSPMSGRIARLFVYPVKSCAGVELQEAVLTETGLELDRAWMVVDEQGEFVSQRELPRMALISPNCGFMTWCCGRQACWRCTWPWTRWSSR
jgi:hypothetical protein